jgi:NTE family protein
MLDEDILSQSVVEPLFHVGGLKYQPYTPKTGVALCLSGGGYRAMLFQVGVLWRLNELNVLSKVAQVSSVSAGSIVAATLGANWGLLHADPAEPDRFDAASFNFALVQPIRQLADHTLDVGAVHYGLVPALQSIGDEIVGFLRYHLFGTRTLQDLPDEPRFVIGATNVKMGTLWRFAKRRMADCLLGTIPAPRVLLAVAVAASSAFPPFLSALSLPLDPADFDPAGAGAFHDPRLRTEALLTDGGLYDHLGIETAWNRFGTILVSYGGRLTSAEPQAANDWAAHTNRMINLLCGQISDVRRRQVVQAFKTKVRRGALWAAQIPIAAYGLNDALDCPAERTAELAEMRPSLTRVSEQVKERLINWGYAACDASMRRYYLPAAPPPAGFPYPRSGV